jgi:IclR family acetate operon transcriptional repressor
MAEKTIKSLEKGIDLLWLFDATRRVIDVKDLAAALGLPLRTTYRFVTTLRRRHVLLLEEGTGRCRLSPGLRRLLAAIDEPGDIARLATPLLTDLAAKSGETVQLFVVSGDDGILVQVAESPQALRVGPRTGQRVPLHCGAGTKVLLAYRPPEEWEAYIQRTGLTQHAPNTVTDPEKLIRDLRRIRRSGVAVTHQEFIPGARALGIPIPDPTGSVTASLSVAGPDTRLTARRARQLTPLALATARQISLALAGGA